MQAFLNFLNRIDKDAPKGWILNIHVGDVELSLKDSVLTMLKNYVQERKARLFEIDKEVFIFFAETHFDDLQILTIKLRFMLGILPTHDESTLYRIYHLTLDLAKVFELVSPQKAGKAPAASIRFNSRFSTQMENPDFVMPFTPTLLDQIEKSLKHADLSNLIRQQPVCIFVGKAPPSILFEEVYVALADLKKTLCPNVDIYQAPFLLNRLLETLDKRVLENASHHDNGSFEKNFSLNLTIKTLLGESFKVFDSTLSANRKETILLEIKQSDILGDIPRFLAARECLKEKGYKVCLDMVTASSLPLIQTEKLGVDYIKLLWNEELIRLAQTPEFVKAVKQNDPRKIILCHVDDKRAVSIGETLGISLFQGYYIQKRLYQA